MAQRELCPQCGSARVDEPSGYNLVLLLCAAFTAASVVAALVSVPFWVLTGIGLILISFALPSTPTMLECQDCRKSWKVVNTA